MRRRCHRPIGQGVLRVGRCGGQGWEESGTEWNPSLPRAGWGCPRRMRQKAIANRDFYRIGTSFYRLATACCRINSARIRLLPNKSTQVVDFPHLAYVRHFLEGGENSRTVGRGIRGMECGNGGERQSCKGRGMIGKGMNGMEGCGKWSAGVLGEWKRAACRFNRAKAGDPWREGPNPAAFRPLKRAENRLGPPWPASIFLSAEQVRLGVGDF